MTANEWMRIHMKECAKQREQAGTYRAGGREIKLLPGFEETWRSTVGDDVSHWSIRCKACGAHQSGTETSS